MGAVIAWGTSPGPCSLRDYWFAEILNGVGSPRTRLIGPKSPAKPWEPTSTDAAHAHPQPGLPASVTPSWQRAHIHRRPMLPAVLCSGDAAPIAPLVGEPGRRRPRILVRRKSVLLEPGIWTEAARPGSEVVIPWDQLVAGSRSCSEKTDTTVEPGVDRQRSATSQPVRCSDGGVGAPARHRELCRTAARRASPGNYRRPGPAWTPQASPNPGLNGEEEGASPGRQIALAGHAGRAAMAKRLLVHASSHHACPTMAGPAGRCR